MGSALYVPTEDGDAGGSTGWVRSTNPRSSRCTWWMSLERMSETETDCEADKRAIRGARLAVRGGRSSVTREGMRSEGLAVGLREGERRGLDGYTSREGGSLRAAMKFRQRWRSRRSCQKRPPSVINNWYNPGKYLVRDIDELALIELWLEIVAPSLKNAHDAYFPCASDYARTAEHRNENAVFKWWMYEPDRESPLAAAAAAAFDRAGRHSPRWLSSIPKCSDGADKSKDNLNDGGPGLPSLMYPKHSRKPWVSAGGDVAFSEQVETINGDHLTFKSPHEWNDGLNEGSSGPQRRRALLYPEHPRGSRRHKKRWGGNPYGDKRLKQGPGTLGAEDIEDLNKAFGAGSVKRHDGSIEFSSK
ncbi:hypothetical protein B0H17DRAFT_1134732 [Mycena rosella]|uniref:Uncharacterized protein n=1 Tax=Mycena rosella TaxID=1033263 RepID=A0AAD7GHV7_MYCRO|nr:hypothetical protein B0H17DRAFT_1134732 [Mycena rosella]